MALIFFMTVAADAEEPDIVRISLKENDSLRSMASTYLGDPNEWKVILYYNGFAGPADVNADTTIAIPVKLYKETAKRILEAGELTRRANMEGAGILAKDIIENSIRLQNDAVALKNKGKLRQARKVAAEAVEYSQKALSGCRGWKFVSTPSPIRMSWALKSVPQVTGVSASVSGLRRK